MTEVFERTELYGKYILEYQARSYVKGTTQVLKRNFFFRFAPDFFFLDKKNNNAILESIIDIHFHTPNIFTQKIIAINGTTRKGDEMQKKAMQFLNFNVYNPTAFNNEVLMPTAKNGFKYYNFFYDSCIDSLGYKFLKIKVEPKVNSQKLISGYLYIIKDLWTVARVEIEGKSDFIHFNVKTNFGMPEKDFLAPKTTELVLTLKLFGNEAVNHYYSSYDYAFIKKYESDEEIKSSSINYDLSHHFNLSSDSTPMVSDSSFWEQNRAKQLTEEEQQIYDNYQTNSVNKNDTLKIRKLSDLSFAKGIFSPKRFEYNSTEFKYSGLFNPFKLGFSGNNGITYWQKLKLKKEFESGRIISYNPDIGYVFKHKEFYFNNPINYLFNPKKMGEIGVSFGNRNQSYNSKIIDEINEIISDSINFNDLNLKYYKHYYLTLFAQQEIHNGLLFKIGSDFHLYRPVKSNSKILLKNSTEEEIAELIDESYKSFTPTVRFQWTPKQFYRINGKRKEYVWSSHPTLSLEYARGIPKIFNSSSDYERLEADIQQNISLGLLRSVQYYAGVGLFTNTQSIYFADFKNFRRHNFPESWDDQIGGVFHLLDSRWYNASNSYLQFHAMYEAPFVFLHFFKNASKDIFKERLYASQLYTSTLPCYTELGYGVGNYIFNMGLFVSLNKWGYQSIGFKFAFELGR